MRRFSLLFLPLIAIATLLNMSCSESEEVGEYDNWQERNEAFLDSVARLAKANADGRWLKLRSYTLGNELGDDGPNIYYVYAQRLEDGTGTLCPVFNDSVRVHYTGRIIPTSTYPLGYTFDKSFSGEALNASTDVPTLLGVGGTVTGFATALMHMVEGDHWRVFIPYYLGYGVNGNSGANIPGYSTLVFDITLARVYRYKVDTDTSWW